MTRRRILLWGVLPFALWCLLFAGAVVVVHTAPVDTMIEG